MALGDSVPHIELYSGPLDGMTVPQSLSTPGGQVAIKSPVGETTRLLTDPGLKSTMRIIEHVYQLNNYGVYAYQTTR